MDYKPMLAVQRQSCMKNIPAFWVSGIVSQHGDFTVRHGTESNLVAICGRQHALLYIWRHFNFTDMPCIHHPCGDTDRARARAGAAAGAAAAQLHARRRSL